MALNLCTAVLDIDLRDTLFLLKIVCIFVELVVDVANKNKWSARRISKSELDSLFSSSNEGVVNIERMIFDAVSARRNVALKLLSYSSPDQLFDKFLVVSKVYELMFLKDQASGAQGRYE